MDNVKVLGEIFAIGEIYMAMQANAAGIPRFRAELTDRLSQLDLPDGIINRILQPVAALALDPNTSSTTFPYLSGEVVNKVRVYLETQGTGISH